MRNTQKTLPLLLQLLLLQLCCLPQSQLPDIMSKPLSGYVNSHIFEIGNKPSLSPIPGAKTPHFESLFLFGDGNYQISDKPQHTYLRPGKYEITAFLSPVYSDDVPPPVQKRTLIVPPTSGGNWNSGVPQSIQLKSKELVSVKHFREPGPGNDIVLILTYGSQSVSIDSTDGTLFFFFNERQFPYRTFSGSSFLDINGAIPASDSISGGMIASDLNSRTGNKFLMNSKIISAMNRYHHSMGFKVSGMAPLEERHLFLRLTGHSQMSLDSGSKIIVESIFIPDSGNIKGYETSASHEMNIMVPKDPNFIRTDRKLISFKTLENTGLEFFVQFGNVGVGTARNVTISVNIDGLSKTRLRDIEILEYSPNLLPCMDTANGRSCFRQSINGNDLIFEFQNIFLPGRKDQRFKTRSSKGHLRFRLKSDPRPVAYKLIAQAKIRFDNLKEICTNKSKVRVVDSRGSFNIGIEGFGGYFYPPIPNPMANNQQANLVASPQRHSFINLALPLELDYFYKKNLGFGLGITLSAGWQIPFASLSSINLRLSPLRIRSQISRSTRIIIGINYEHVLTGSTTFDIYPNPFPKNLSYIQGFLAFKTQQMVKDPNGEVKISPMGRKKRIFQDIRITTSYLPHLKAWMVGLGLLGIYPIGKK